MVRASELLVSPQFLRRSLKKQKRVVVQGGGLIVGVEFVRPEKRFWRSGFDKSNHYSRTHGSQLCKRSFSEISYYFVDKSQVVFIFSSVKITTNFVRLP